MRCVAPLLMVVSMCCDGLPVAAQSLRGGSLSGHVAVEGDRISGVSFDDVSLHASLAQGELFRLKLAGGREIGASTLRVTTAPAVTPLAAQPSASRAAARLAGQQLCVEMEGAGAEFSARWCLVARGDAPYLREELTVRAGRAALPLEEVQLFRTQDAAAKVVGTVAGSPVVSGDVFFGVEEPLSYSSVQAGMVEAGIRRTLPLGAGQSITYSAVVGVARPGQLRRDFLAYVEAERAHPYRTFLHPNTWYDLGEGQRFSAADVLGRMNTFGEELVRKRGVTLDSYLLDDGWDKTDSLWQMNAGFPEGVAPLRAAAERYGFGVGMWLSPWGGYDKEKDERVAFGRANGYELVEGGYALSGPKYYAAFEKVCLDFLSRGGVNQFKLDGTGNAGQVFPGSIFDSDFAAAIHLIDRLREQRSDLFINLTTGTKPSPFWLRYADSIYRSGEDHDFAGEGTWRERWITYRDAQTYANVVKRGPLFPLNSLMLHGIIYAAKAEHLGDDPGHDFAAEVHSFFGSGTDLQELYVTPSLLSAQDWSVLAESARWSRSRAATLVDTHWTGGDPAKGEPYGWAAWAAGRGTLTVRNPSARAQEMTLDVEQALELAGGDPQRFSAHSPWTADAAQPALELRAGVPYRLMLAPFQVVTLDVVPSR